MNFASECKRLLDKPLFYICCFIHACLLINMDYLFHSFVIRYQPLKSDIMANILMPLSDSSLWFSECSYMTSLFSTIRTNAIDYMELRLWIGLHSCIQCLILVASDASYIIKYMTRFTEEGFSSLISFIFISDAIKKMVGAFQYYPINMNFKPDYITTYKCECLSPDQGEDH